MRYPPAPLSAGGPAHCDEQLWVKQLVRGPKAFWHVLSILDTQPETHVLSLHWQPS
jgi:hypothetical protein